MEAVRWRPTVEPEVRCEACGLPYAPTSIIAMGDVPTSYCYGPRCGGIQWLRQQTISQTAGRARSDWLLAALADAADTASVPEGTKRTAKGKEGPGW